LKSGKFFRFFYAFYCMLAPKKFGGHSDLYRYEIIKLIFKELTKKGFRAGIASRKVAGSP
jgi:hypothetical protein